MNVRVVFGLGPRPTLWAGAVSLGWHVRRDWRADGTYQRLLTRLAKIDVLVLDDFAILPLTEESRRDLLEIL